VEIITLAKMSLPTFYHHARLIEGDVVVLSPDESHHASRVRRLDVGDEVRVINGEGEAAVGEIAQTSDRDAVEVSLVNVSVEPGPAIRVEIASALPKGDRVKVMLDMLTQLGVSGFCPLDCERSETRFRESMEEKWRRLVIESCKQCGRARTPEFDARTRIPIDFARSRIDKGIPVLVCDTGGPRFAAGDRLAAGAESVAIMIGPEGGFTGQELRDLIGEGCQLLGLPGNVLRIEAAAVCAAVLYIP
jgi:16S rRNA (uracil1498-N3)-methyltransferase